MPRGLNATIISELAKTTVGGIIYLIKLTLKSGIQYWGERSLSYSGNSYTARILHIGDLEHGSVNGDSLSVEIDLANVDGAITTLDRAESFIGAKLEIIEYIDSIALGYVKWVGWCDDITSIDLLTARITAYAGPATSGMEVPRRTISTQCQWEFGNYTLYVDGTEFDGAECPYQRTSTIGFKTTTSQDINNSSDPVTFTINALPDSQVFKIGDEIIIDSEVLIVTTATSGSVTALRAQKGTTIASHSSGATVKFYSCQYSTSACLRRGMYGNNTSDQYSGKNRNYFGGFPTITGNIFGKFRDKAGEKARKLSITFAGNESAYGRPLPLIYGRCKFVDPTLIIARPEGDFLLALFAVAEGILGTTSTNSSQANTLDAYVTGSDGIENIYVNGVKRHDPRPGYGVEVFNGQMDQPAPSYFNGISDFDTYEWGLWGTAWVCLRINIANNPSVDPTNINATGDFEIQYGRCVRVYTTTSVYTFKPTGGSPVWALLDYMTSKRTGGGIDHTRVNIQSFLDVEDYRDNTVTNVIDGTSVIRWSFNGAIDNRKAYADHERSICLGMYCLPPYIDADGKLKIRALKSESLSGLTLFSSTSGTSRNIVCNDGVSSLKKTRGSLLSIPNEVRVNFVALESEGWIKTQLVLADRDLQRQLGKILGDGSIRVISKSVDLPGCTSIDEAARLGTLILRAGEFAAGGSMNNLKITFTTFYKDSQNLEIGDIIQLEDALLDPATEGYFRVLEIRDTAEDLDQGGVVYNREITATLHDNAIYDDTAYTVSLVNRLNPPLTTDAEPPAVTNFNITESGLVDDNGVPKSQLVIEYTEPGEDEGEIDNLTGYSLGATTVHVDGIVAGTVLKVNDIFKVVGHNTIYRVTEEVTFTGGEADVKITPALEAAVVDNDDCSIIVYGDDRGSFGDVAIFRSTTETGGSVVVGDWRFLTIVKRSGATYLHDVSGEYECFAAISRNLAHITPSIETKDSSDNYKYPRDTVLVDGIPDVLDPPSNLNAAGGKGLIKITWDGYTTAFQRRLVKHFVLYRGTTSDPAASTAIAQIDTTQYLDTLAEDDTTLYYYWIATRDIRDTLSNKSSSVNARQTTDAAVPDAPTLTAVCALLGDKVLKFSFGAESTGSNIEGVSKLVIEIASGSDTDFTPLYDTISVATDEYNSSFTTTLFVPFHFRAKVINAFGSSAWTTLLNVQLSATNPLIADSSWPSAVKNLTVEVTDDDPTIPGNELVVKWEMPDTNTTTLYAFQVDIKNNSDPWPTDTVDASGSNLVCTIGSNSWTAAGASFTVALITDSLFIYRDATVDHNHLIWSTPVTGVPSATELQTKAPGGSRYGGTYSYQIVKPSWTQIYAGAVVKTYHLDKSIAADKTNFSAIFTKLGKGTYYIRVCAGNEMGLSDYTYAGPVTIDGINQDDLDPEVGGAVEGSKQRPTPINGTFTNNSPGAGSVAWASVSIVYNGTTYAITNGNTSSKWIVWKVTNPNVFTGYGTPQALAPGEFLVGMNVSGTFLQGWGTANPHGEMLRPGTVTGGTSGIIGSGTIEAYNIVSNTITAAEIAAIQLSAISADCGTITAGTITGITITGSTVQTASPGSNPRIVMAGNELLGYDSGGSEVFKVSGGYVYADYIKVDTITAQSSNFYLLSHYIGSSELEFGTHINLMGYGCSNGAGTIISTGGQWQGDGVSCQNDEIMGSQVRAYSGGYLIGSSTYVIDNNQNFYAASGMGYHVDGIKIIGNRGAGITYASYTGQDVSSSYVESEVQQIDDKVVALSTAVAAIISRMSTHGLIS